MLLFLLLGLLITATAAALPGFSHPRRNNQRPVAYLRAPRTTMLVDDDAAGCWTGSSRPGAGFGAGMGVAEITRRHFCHSGEKYRRWRRVSHTVLAVCHDTPRPQGQDPPMLPDSWLTDLPTGQEQPPTLAAGVTFFWQQMECWGNKPQAPNLRL